MLKALLFACVCLLSIRGFAQSQEPEQAATSQDVADTTHTINEVSCSSTDNSNITLTWSIKNRMPPFFVIERSEDGKSFETVAVLNNQQAKSIYQWTDEAPRKGRSFYRLRYSFEENRPQYSQTASYYLAGSLAAKFYPNPVDGVLIVRSETPVDVQIADNNGRIRITESRVQGLRTINVSSLEKGIYLIRFSNKLTNVISQEKLVKN